MPRPADHGSTCDRCDDLIYAGQPVVVRHGVTIHATCAPGGDE